MISESIPFFAVIVLLTIVVGIAGFVFGLGFIGYTTYQAGTSDEEVRRLGQEREMTNIGTKISTNRQPCDLTVDYEAMRVDFTFGSHPFSLPISAYNTTNADVFGSELFSGSVSVSVAEDDIKKLCLSKNHSLADFEAIRLGIKAFLRDHQTFVVNGVEYRLRREDVLVSLVMTIRSGERVPKQENKESEAA